MMAALTKGAENSMRIFSGLHAHARVFLKDKAGNLAVILALSAIPLTLAMGAGVDYARGLAVHSNMTDALDSAALAVGAAASKPSSCSSDGSASPTTGNGPTSNPTPCATLQEVAQQYFNANFKRDSSADAVGTVSIAIANQSVTLTVSDNVPTTFLQAADRLMNTTALDNMDVSANSTVVWGQTKLWVGLVLDNTGSMSQTDSSGTSKISAEKTASHNLITTLQAASANVGDVQMTLVPFAKLVNIGTSYVSSPYIDWTDWLAAPPGAAPGAGVGPGSSCPWTVSSNGFNCVNQPSGTSSASTIPSSGTYSGYICPSVVQTYTSSGSLAGMGGHYFNGCYTSTTVLTIVSGPSSGASCTGFVRCSCTGSGSSKVCKQTNYTHAWVTNPTSTWNGCIEDRPQDYDIVNTAPATSTPNSLFPAANDDNCPPAKVVSLPSSWTTSQWTTLGTEIDAMTPNGSTNQTIGLEHGWQTLTNSGPYNAPALPANTSQYIILISDGLNTQDRWYGDGSNQSSGVDTRMADACANAKSAGITIYTIFVDLNGTQGNSTVLQNCATSTSKYFDLTTSGAIITTLNNIAQQITNLRVSR
jgi:hypothetical protein